MCDLGITEADEIEGGEVIGDSDDEESGRSGGGVWEGAVRRVSVEMDEAFAFGEFERRYELIGTLRSPRRREAETGFFVFDGDWLLRVNGMNSKDEHRL